MEINIQLIVMSNRMPHPSAISKNKRARILIHSLFSALWVEYRLSFLPRRTFVCDTGIVGVVIGRCKKVSVSLGFVGESKSRNTGHRYQ